ncbi:MAG: hypothetical protein JO227_13755 [Acetobacteraceae bacterium]|nr:hypothetical protein [Acetobacteraceae bacterium]
MSLLAVRNLTTAFQTTRGEITVEQAPVQRIFDHPLHPYTVGLLECVPLLAQDQDRLTAIPGTSPDPAHRPPGCRLMPRCRHATPMCAATVPLLAPHTDGHAVACISVPEIGYK